ncbi:unnamed protein product [Spirodela intermedia]|uniref:Uncharacterized protein n=1 Tax=Spirodela intermedia TaxID=51605 RepID=A0A7I8LE76_SPIIN|nr:unnamed protein product [Spirodela intermedia]
MEDKGDPPGLSEEQQRSEERNNANLMNSFTGRGVSGEKGAPRGPRRPPPRGPQAAPVGDPAAENGGTSGDTRGMEASKENGVGSAGEATAILRSVITAPGGQSSVAPRPYRKKRTKMQRTGCPAKWEERMKMTTTDRPELNGDDGGGKGNHCQQGVTGEIEASCCRGKRRKVGGSGGGSNDEETSPAPWGRAMDIDLNRLAPRGRAMDIDL